MFAARVIGTNGKKTERMPLSSTSKYYEPGSTHTIVLPGDVVGKPNSVEITWEYRTSVFNPLTWRLNTPRAYIDSLTIKNLETDYKLVYCFFTKMFFFSEKFRQKNKKVPEVRSANTREIQS